MGAATTDGILMSGGRSQFGTAFNNDVWIHRVRQPDPIHSPACHLPVWHHSAFDLWEKRIATHCGCGCAACNLGVQEAEWVFA